MSSPIDNAPRSSASTSSTSSLAPSANFPINTPNLMNFAMSFPRTLKPPQATTNPFSIIQFASIASGNHSASSSLPSTASFCPSSSVLLRPNQNEQNPESTDCVVCGDKSSGKHYGQYSCEGCKSFFKRSIRRALSYSCRGSKDCVVDIHHRNQCQYCRLKKCIKMGMRKEAVQRGRLPAAFPLPFPSAAFLSPPLFYRNPYSAGYLMSQFMTNAMRNITDINSTQHLAINNNNYSENRSENSNPNNVLEIAAQLLFSLVHWTRSLPAFGDISVKDQSILLSSNWAQLFFVSCAMLHSNSVDIFSSSNISQLLSSCSIDQSSINSLKSELEQVTALALDFTELNLFRATILFNPASPSLTDPKKIESIQEKMHTSLEEYSKLNKSSQPNRLDRLLSCISSLRTIDATVIEKLFFSKLLSGRTTVGDILSDLLQNPIAPTSVPNFTLTPNSTPIIPPSFNSTPNWSSFCGLFCPPSYYNFSSLNMANRLPIMNIFDK